MRCGVSVAIGCANVMPTLPDASQGVVTIRNIKNIHRRNARKLNRDDLAVEPFNLSLLTTEELNLSL